MGIGTDLRVILMKLICDEKCVTESLLNSSTYTLYFRIVYTTVVSVFMCHSFECRTDQLRYEYKFTKQNLPQNFGSSFMIWLNAYSIFNSDLVLVCSLYFHFVFLHHPWRL